MRQRLTVIVERAPTNYSAYVPDVLGCIATGDRIEQTVADLAEALIDYLAVLVEDGQPLPQPTTTTRDVTSHSPADYITTIEVEVPDQAAQPVVNIHSWGGMG